LTKGISVQREGGAALGLVYTIIMIGDYKRLLESRKVARYVKGTSGDGGPVVLRFADEAVAELAVLDNGVEVSQTGLLFLALHLELERGLASRYPEAGVERGVLGAPTTATRGLAQSTGLAQRVRAQFTKRVVRGRRRNLWDGGRQVDERRTDTNVRKLR